MKAIKLMIVVMLGWVPATMAQEEPTHPGKREVMLEKLSLSAEQMEKIRAIDEDYREKIRNEMHATSKNSDEVMKLRKEKHEKVKEVLTPEQLKKLEELKKESRENAKAMHEELRKYRKERIEPVMKQKREEFEAALTGEEKATIQQCREKLKRFKNENRGPKGEGKEGTNKVSAEKRKKMAEQRKRIHTENQEALKPILTAHREKLDQIEKDLEPMKAEWKNDMQAIREKYTEPGMHHSQGKRKHLKKERDAELKGMGFLLMEPGK